MEVGLLNHAVLNGDFAECILEPGHHARLNLLVSDIGIDQNTGVHRVGHFVHFDFTVGLDFDFGNQATVSLVALNHRHAMEVTGRQRFAITSTIRSQVNHAEIQGLVAQQDTAIGHRIHARGGGHLVEHDFLRKRVQVVRHRTPVTDTLSRIDER